MRDKLILPIAVLCSSLLMLLAVFLGYSIGHPSTAAEASLPSPALSPPAASATLPALEGSITIPGFDRLQLTASTDQQAAPFCNPEGNDCYFVLSLFLPSGEEIFRSGLVPPGTSIPTMTLAVLPPAGVYENSILRYSCYSLDSMQPLNGADVKLTVEII